MSAFTIFGLLGAAKICAIHHEESASSASPERPAQVLKAIRDGADIYYLGIGSNLSRTKLENRSICGSKIHLISMEPCVIPHYRLAFNMQALPPLEPGMGSLEPLPSETNTSASVPLHPFEKEECHAALIRLSAEDYEKVAKSEGVGTGKRQGYEEIVVTAVPYDSSHPPVQAVAFRVREHKRLLKDPCPSRRYMGILREGAKELGLKPCYQKWLEDHPVQISSPLLTTIAVNNLFFTATVSFRLKLRVVSNIQSWLLFQLAYVPSNEPSKAKRVYGEVMSGLILLPGSLPGLLLKHYQQMRGTMSPMMKAIIQKK